MLTFLFFICEFITAQVTDSDTILADAFHMFSDFIALALGLYCSELTKLSKKPESSSSLDENSKINKKFTFGYERAEIVGAFANSVFLAALTFDIVLDAIDRFILVPTQIKNPQLLIAVGILGLVINICGLIMFCGCGSEAPVHGHTHDGFSHGHSHGGDSENLNIKAVILHLFGDAVGSLAVIVSAIVIFIFEDSECHDKHSDIEMKLLNSSSHYNNSCWVYYIDPALSLLVSTLILATLIPVLRSTVMILLETCNRKHINIDSIKTCLEAKRLESEKHGVIWSFGGLRVWDLTPGKTFMVVKVFLECGDNGVSSWLENHKTVFTEVKKSIKDDFGLEDVCFDMNFGGFEGKTEL